MIDHYEKSFGWVSEMFSAAHEANTYEGWRDVSKTLHGATLCAIWYGPEEVGDDLKLLYQIACEHRHSASTSLNEVKS